MKLLLYTLPTWLLCSTLGAANDDQNLATNAQSVLKKHCYQCHGRDGVAKGGFGYLLDREQLVARGKVMPGTPVASELYQKVSRGDMPPAGKQPRPDKDDIAVLERWIKSGAPAFSARKPRDFIPDAAVLQAILADLNSLDIAQRRQSRYLTLAHLANAGRTDEDLQTVRMALSKLINSLSWQPRITRPQPVDTNALIYRIDLRDYRWSASFWDRLVSVYPYWPSNTNDPLAQASKTELPVLRADWFIATASRAPFYYDLLQMPVTERTLERMLGIDVPDNISRSAAQRVGFNDSGVSKNNRVLERHDGAHGGYWRSYDFAGNTERQNIFEHPLGPNAGAVSFAHAGGEIIFSLPNGLHGFLITDGNGRRLDKAPSEIVSDPKRPDQRVEAGVSCMSCHVHGLIPKADQVRAHAEKNLAFTKADRARIEALYAPNGLQKFFDEDKQRYLQALAKAGVAADVADPVSTVVLHYESTLDGPAAAAELGLTPAEFAERLAATPELSRILRPLTLKGGTVQRQVFEEAYPRFRDVRFAAKENAAENRPFTGHTTPVLCVAFTPDGRLAASSGADRTVRIWNVAGGALLKQFDAQTRDVAALTFTPDGKCLLTAGQDRIVRIWDLASEPTLKGQARGHTDRIRCLAVSGDGRHALSGGDDNTIRCWNVSTGAEVSCLQGHTRPVSGVVVIPGRSQAVSASLDGTVRMWDLSQGEEIRCLKGHVGEVYAVAVSADGKWILSGGNDRSVRLWNAEDGGVRSFPGHSNAIIRVAFAADQRTILSASSQYRATDKVIRLWDLDGRELQSLSDPGASIATLAFTADGSAALSGGSDTSLRFWQWSRR